MELWEELLKKAIKIIKSSGIPQNTSERFFWSFGGGTALMLNYEHRLSKDIDIFLIDRQLLGYFSPRINSEAESETVYYREEAEYIKLQLQKGEIDFIVAQKQTDTPYKILRKFDIDIPCESPLEIIAKKVIFRCNDFTLRDFFDLATMIKYLENEQEKKLLQKIIEPHVEILEKRLKTIPQFFSDASKIIYLPKGEKIVNEGKEILIDYFENVHGNH